MLVGDFNADDIRNLRKALDHAADLLRNNGARYLAPAGVELKKQQREACQSAADAIADLSAKITELGRPNVDQNDLQAQLRELIQVQIRPKVLNALDAFRESFISIVLKRQDFQRRQSERSLTELDMISKKIFLVSINASVEAARLGNSGAGFTFISKEIRSLSQTAQAAIEDMRTD